MTARDDFDRHLSAWLDATAPQREPEHLLETVLARTARTRRRPAWRIPERWIPLSVTTSMARPSRVPWRTVSLAALLILALAAAAALVAGTRKPALPSPFGFAANGPIVYASEGQIYLRQTLDAAPTVFAAGPDKITAFFSPRGDKVAFLESAGAAGSILWVADPDGRNAIKLGGPFLHDDWYEWSPDGSLIAVQSDIGPSTAISLVRTDGSGGRILDLKGMPAGMPTFRPTDGQQLLIRGLTHGAIGMDWGFYLVNLDGSGLTKLDLDPGFADDPDYNGNRDYYFLSPMWSPDGTRIAFHTLEPIPGDPGFRVHTAAVSASGTVSDEHILEYDPASTDEFAATWLPGGDGLVFESLGSGVLKVRTGAPDPGATARDIGDAAQVGSGWPDGGVTYALSPDGALVVARTQLPAGSGAGPRPLWVSDVATGRDTRDLFAADDIVSWQRLAR